jgi:hypothetical protein
LFCGLLPEDMTARKDGIFLIKIIQMKSDDISNMAKNYILLACNKEEVEGIGLVFEDHSYNEIAENALRLLNFYEPDMGDGYIKYAVVMEIDRIMNSYKHRKQLGIL